MADHRGLMNVTVTPAAAGEQLVRLSLPVPRGLLAEGDWLAAHHAGRPVPTGVRVLTWHAAEAGAPRRARRAIVTWAHRFADTRPVEFTLHPTSPPDTAAAPRLPVRATVTGEEITITWDGGPVVQARLIAPVRMLNDPPRVEVVESHPLYSWQRIHLPDRDWPRIIEVRIDALGQAVLVGHVRRDLPGNAYAPDLGWDLDFRHLHTQLRPADPAAKLEGQSLHTFEAGQGCELCFEDPPYDIYHPAAPFKRKGSVRLDRDVKDRTAYRYLRCRDGDKTPMQQAAWQRFEVVIAPAGLARLSPTLECPHNGNVDPRLWDELYRTGDAPDLSNQPELAAAMAYHHQAILHGVALGDDWGNLTGFSGDAPPGSAVFGMNRLNHCPPIFDEGWRSGDRRLVEAGVLWCENFHDQSIWWGPQHTGGTRYNNGRWVDHFPPEGDAERYMWRSNRTIHFCTKGYDSFLLAYEQTGDPRMLGALEAQVASAAEHVHTDDGECRNIGDVQDFVRLYHHTGRPEFLAHARRLFRELTSKLWPDGLFDQGGRPQATPLPFIDNDADGINIGYAKPYIIGYALAGLPALLQLEPGLPRLRQVVQAVADFLADSQDPLGAWRYPHPRSSAILCSQGIEHAWQLVQADLALGPQEKHLDAIERVLRQRIQCSLKTGRLLSGVTGWEHGAGVLAGGRKMSELYARPEDRDPARDYTEGAIGTGSAPPEGLVYFPEVLAFYLRHRPAARLFTPPEADQPLAKVLARLPGVKEYQKEGVADSLPVFRAQALQRMHYPLAWPSGGGGGGGGGGHRDFAAWKKAARAKVIDCLLGAPPGGPFAPALLAEQDRGSYVARKVVFNLSGDSRVLAYLLVPKAAGPHPAVLLLHDHGARFDIGKEKVIEPFDDRPERIASARQWIGQCYGGRFIGDELARRGYVCLATDMLNWSDRGGAGYEGQQALACNLLHMGMSWAGLIAHEDLRAAAFLAGLPEVDPARIGAMGLSVGSYRTWQLSALSDHIRAGVAICWMATIRAQMRPRVNQAGGQSAFCMVHPGLGAHLDFPDVASIACPKPMLFYNGLRDGLFTPDEVREAYAKMRQVWESQAAGDKLETRLWDVPHQFTREMQEVAFAWLEKELI